MSGRVEAIWTKRAHRGVMDPDHILTLGDVRIRLHGETRPCDRMDAQVEGLTTALDTDWGRGAFGVVLDDGEIRVGDAATLEATSDVVASATIRT